ncbi:hypothetical protein MY11210_002046 [Beauveria gryllotalpidicola]
MDGTATKRDAAPDVDQVGDAAAEHYGWNRIHRVAIPPLLVRKNGEEREATLPPRGWQGSQDLKLNASGSQVSDAMKLVILFGNVPAEFIMNFFPTICLEMATFIIANIRNQYGMLMLHELPGSIRSRASPEAAFTQSAGEAKREA